MNLKRITSDKVVAVLGVVILILSLVLVFGCATTRYEKTEPYFEPADTTSKIGADSWTEGATSKCW